MTRQLYRVYRLFLSIQSRGERRLTRGGTVVLGGAIASAILGLDTDQTLAYQLFAFLVGLLAVSMVSNRRFRPRVDIERALPRLVTAGEPFHYRVRLRNRAPHAERGLLVQEELAAPLPSYEEFRDTPTAGDEDDSRVDRWFGYRRWERLVAAGRSAMVQEQAVPTISPHGDVEVRAEVLPRHRGYLRFTGLRITRTDPFGLARASVTAPLPQSVLVLPRRYRVPRVRLPGARRYQPGGVALTSSVGDSEEFVSLRDYQPGDPLRRIHWRSWARLGKPIVKEYQAEFFMRHALVLDTFTTSQRGAVFEEAVSVAASFASSLDTQESLLDLMFVGPEAYCFTAGHGLGHVERLLEVLACVRVCRDKPVRALRELTERHAASLSGCIVVLIAWDQERQALVRSLRARGLPTLVVVVGEASSDAPVPGGVVHLQVGKIAEGLARL